MFWLSMSRVVDFQLNTNRLIRTPNTIKESYQRNRAEQYHRGRPCKPRSRVFGLLHTTIIDQHPSSLPRNVVRIIDKPMNTTRIDPLISLLFQLIQGTKLRMDNQIGSWSSEYFFMLQHNMFGVHS